MVRNKHCVRPYGLYDFRMNDDVSATAFDLDEISIDDAILFGQPRMDFAEWL